MQEATDNWVEEREDPSLRSLKSYLPDLYRDLLAPLSDPSLLKSQELLVCTQESSEKGQSEATDQDAALVDRSTSHLIKEGGTLHLAPRSATQDREDCLEKRILERGLRAAVVLSGGPAPGGHNVICALYDTLKLLYSRRGEKRGEVGERGIELRGYQGGPRGILEGRYRLLHEELLAPYRDRAGFHLLGTGRDKIEAPQDLERAFEELESLDLLVVIGGDDSNTNSAMMAQYFAQKGSAIRVVGVPKTIDGDLRSALVETTFGHHSACALYARLVRSLAIDALASQKYYHFIRLMGRSASHVTLEVARAARPTWTLLSEEVREKKQTLSEIVEEIASLVLARAAKKIHWGTICLPEGLIEGAKELSTLIEELEEKEGLKQESTVRRSKEEQRALVRAALSSHTREFFDSLPPSFIEGLFSQRDAHGNMQVSKIETERLLASMVTRRVEEQGGEMRFQTHFFGYEARGIDPTPFDARYGYCLGVASALLFAAGITGALSCVGKLAGAPSSWVLQYESLASLLGYERRLGEEKLVIGKALVDLRGENFARFVTEREEGRLLALARAPLDGDDLRRGLEGAYERPYDLPPIELPPGPLHDFFN